MQDEQKVVDWHPEHPVGQVAQVFVRLSANVPAGQLEAETQLVPERKFVVQLRQLVDDVQFPHGLTQAVQLLELL